MGAQGTQVCCVQINHTMKRQKIKVLAHEKKAYCKSFKHSL